MKRRMPFAVARSRSRRSNLSPSPRRCQASATVERGLGDVRLLVVAHVAGDADRLAGDGVERADGLVVDVVDLGEERQLLQVERRP